MNSGVYFSPGDDCKFALQYLMKKAKQSLDICVFTISDNEITKEIVHAHHRGINVRIITDNLKSEDRGSDIYYLAKEGVPLVMDDSPNHMHHKFMIVDGDCLANGSFNWTRSASERNQENIVVMQEIEIISKFQETFDDLWMRFKKI